MTATGDILEQGRSQHVDLCLEAPDDVGQRLARLAVDTAWDRMRRARLCLDILDRDSGTPRAMSAVGGPAPPVPCRLPVTQSHRQD